MDIRLRIKELITIKKMSQNGFAKKIDVSGPRLTQALGGKGFGVDLLEKIVETFPDINGHWLLTGTGDPINSVTISGNAQINQGTIHAEAVHVTQHNGESLDRCRAEVEALKKENQMLERLLESKEEIIQMMKTTRE